MTNIVDPDQARHFAWKVNIMGEYKTKKASLFAILRFMLLKVIKSKL